MLTIKCNQTLDRVFELRAQYWYDMFSEWNIFYLFQVAVILSYLRPIRISNEIRKYNNCNDSICFYVTHSIWNEFVSWLMLSKINSMSSTNGENIFRFYHHSLHLHNVENNIHQWRLHNIQWMKWVFLR